MADREAAYVVPLNDAGTEALVFAPLSRRNGWARYFGPTGSVLALVRFELGSRSELPERPIVVRQVDVAGLGRPLPSSALRTLPLGRFEAAVNQRRHYSILAAAVPPEPRSVRPLPLEDGLRGWGDELPATEWLRPSSRLDIPAGTGKKPDAFYGAVAESFAWLSAHSSSPAQDLADANAVPVTTVHRWVREARSRGFLPPAFSRRQAKGDDE